MSINCNLISDMKFNFQTETSGFLSEAGKQFWTYCVENVKILFNGPQK